MHNNSANGLITKIWGPKLWFSLHCISFGYPEQPTPEQREKYKQFFESIQYVLPCIYCRESCSKMYHQLNNQISDEHFKDRKSLTKWLYDLHNQVNNKLGKKFDLSYHDVCKYYESFRVKCDPSIENDCIMPLSLKAKAFQNADITYCPSIDYFIVNQFSCYANQLGLKDFDKYSLYYFKHLHKPEINLARHLVGSKIVKYMKHNGKRNVDENGLPTKLELLLMQHLCTTLSFDEIQTALQKLK